MWSGGKFSMRLMNDAVSNGVVPLVITGGAGTGITSITSNSGTGSWVHSGNMEVENENHSFVANGAKGNVTLQSVVQGGGVVSFFDSTRPGNDHVAQWIWYNGSLMARFLDDSGGVVKVPLSINGGEGTGITGITSDSGTGEWKHTGNFAADLVFTKGFTIATLPTPSAALEGARAFINDGASGVVYGQAVGTTTGTLKLPVFCTGAAWIYA
jgi:hypothetical protein